jgi:tyrosinase
MGYFMIAGIHCLPFVPYDNDDPLEDEGGWQGYCHHGSTLFPVWHRPYVLLLEKSIKIEADRIAKLYTTEQTEWMEASRALRFPYWEWESKYTAMYGLPHILTDQSVFVDTPIGRNTEITNPLRGYTLPTSLGTMYRGSDCFNPTAKPSYRVTCNILIFVNFFVS